MARGQASKGIQRVYLGAVVSGAEEGERMEALLPLHWIIQIHIHYLKYLASLSVRTGQ